VRTGSVEVLEQTPPIKREKGKSSPSTLQGVDVASPRAERQFSENGLRSNTRRLFAFYYVVNPCLGHSYLTCSVGYGTVGPAGASEVQRLRQAIFGPPVNITSNSL
jgi:hypothetical protein